MLLSRRETIRFYTSIGIQIGLALCVPLVLVWGMLLLTGLVADMRQQIRQDIERDRRSQQEHDTCIVNASIRRLAGVKSSLCPTTSTPCWRASQRSARCWSVHCTPATTATLALDTAPRTLHSCPLHLGPGEGAGRDA